MSEMPALSDALPRDFYERPVNEVARDLLGCYLVRRHGRQLLGGRIVEVEAYGGPEDPGSHAARAPDGRARIMFGPPGVAYVYFTYGMHHCVNAVTQPAGSASAVLIRALEPLWGVDTMRRNAPATLKDHLLGSGPGRLCRALRIDRQLNEEDLVRGRLRILDRDRTEPVSSGRRVGLSTDDGRAWRFWIHSRSVSRPVGRPAS